MICSISGEVPKEPVISPKSGAIFDRKHIINYISASGTDPINDELLTAEELITINTTISNLVPPKPPKYISIPSMLSEFQNEWDALALEVFTLKKQLHKAKEELSAALYHYDAAVRVAARAIKERDEAKNALEQLTASIGKGEIIEDNTTIVNPLIPVDKINQARDELYQLHKLQKPTLSIDPDLKILIKLISNNIQPFKEVSTVYFRSNDKTLLIGSPTGSVLIYNFNKSGKESFTKLLYNGKITGLTFISYNNEELILVACKDKLLVGNDKFPFNHNHEHISQIITHPKLKNLFIILSDYDFSLNDINISTLFKSERFPFHITTGDIHMDGALLGIGNDKGQVIIYNIPTTELVLKLNTTNTQVRKLKFVLNGYWLLASSSNTEGLSNLDIFDLRKVIMVHSIEFKADLIDFTMDPSSSLIITYDSSNKLILHRFIKKGKKWLNNIAQTTIEPADSVKHIDMLTGIHDDSFISKNEIKIIAVTDNSSVLEYELFYS